MVACKYFITADAREKEKNQQEQTDQKHSKKSGKYRFSFLICQRKIWDANIAWIEMVLVNVCAFHSLSRCVCADRTKLGQKTRWCIFKTNAIRREIIINTWACIQNVIINLGTFTVFISRTFSRNAFDAQFAYAQRSHIQFAFYCRCRRRREHAILANHFIAWTIFILIFEFDILYSSINPFSTGMFENGICIFFLFIFFFIFHSNHAK